MSEDNGTSNSTNVSNTSTSSSNTNEPVSVPQDNNDNNDKCDSDVNIPIKFDVYPKVEFTIHKPVLCVKYNC